MAEGVLAVDPSARHLLQRGVLKAIGFRGATFEGLSLLELVRDTGLHQLLAKSWLLANLAISALNCPPPTAAHLRCRRLLWPCPPAAAPSRSCTTSPRSNGWSRFARTSSPMCRMSCGHLWQASSLCRHPARRALEDQANNRKFVEIIRSNAVRLSSIASDLLVLSDLESGSDRNLKRSPCRPCSRRPSSPCAAKPRTEVRLVSEHIEMCSFPAAACAGKAILNLMANAIKFTSQAVRCGSALR